MIRLEPAPGLTVPGVGVPVPDEREAVDAAVNYGWLIAVVLVGAAVITVGRAVTKRIDFRLLGIMVAVGFIAYQVGKGH
jgi:hypothetical protein